MKKITLNIPDIDFERLRLEAIEKRCDIGTLIKDRIFYVPFSADVEYALDKWLEYGINKILVE